MSSNGGSSSSSIDRDCNMGHVSSVSANSEMLCHNFVWNKGGDDNSIDSNGGKDGEDESGTSQVEDLEVRMDLTDDLLHMVHYFPYNDLFSPLFLYLNPYFGCFIFPGFFLLGLC